MTVTNRQLGTLAAVSGALVVATVLVYGIEHKPSVGAMKGALLVQGLELDKVARITVKQKDKTVSFEKTDGAYLLAERKGYPAAVKKVNELIIEVLGIRIAGKMTASAGNHEKLGVDESGEEATVIDFLDTEGKRIVAVLVGKNAERSAGNYVRLAGQDIVYVSEESVRPATDVTGYLDTDLLDVKKDDVASVSVTLPGESYEIGRNDEKKIVLRKVPEDRQQEDRDVESAFNALASFSFDDVATSEPEGLKLDATYTCKTLSHLTFAVRIGKQADKHYARFACRGPDATAVAGAKRINKADPKAKLEQKAAVLTAADTAANFNRRYGRWLFELSSHQAEKMRKPLKDLTKEKPKEKPKDKTPEEISANHILVAYKGASRASDKITRTKDEAMQRAEELLKNIKDGGADFAESAKKNSDGPSGTKGGDLGTFKKGAMHKNFETAAWKLAVDEVSGVVETPFGFHLIKRTR